MEKCDKQENKNPLGKINNNYYYSKAGSGSHGFQDGGSVLTWLLSINSELTSLNCTYTSTYGTVPVCVPIVPLSLLTWQWHVENRNYKLFSSNFHSIIFFLLYFSFIYFFYFFIDHFFRLFSFLCAFPLHRHRLASSCYVYFIHLIFYKIWI